VLPKIHFGLFTLSGFPFIFLLKYLVQAIKFRLGSHNKNCVVREHFSMDIKKGKTFAKANPALNFSTKGVFLLAAEGKKEG
jgi:hypothetical protein